MKDVSATLFNACDERSKTARGGHAGSFVHALVTKTAVEFIAHKLAPRPASFYEGTSNIVTERFELFASFELFPVLFNKRGKGEWFTRLGQILLCTVRRASATFISRIDPGSPTSGSRRSFVFRWHTLRNSTIKVGNFQLASVGPEGKIVRRGRWSVVSAKGEVFGLLRLDFGIWGVTLITRGIIDALLCHNVWGGGGV